jgi:hypothetical protein|tara:strand:+ start:173 stop:748 length:576 start_codon:yes stop_codon:yes gene_type:complete
MKSYLYPKSKTVSPFLLQKIKDNCVDKVPGGARRTEFNLHKKGIQEVDNLISWIQSIIPKVSHEFGKYGEDFNKSLDPNPSTEPIGIIISTINTPGEEKGYNVNAFNIKESWGLIYDKGAGVIRHNHYPYTLSFVYFVNIPDGSSSIIMEGEEIIPIEGTVLFFLSHRYHEIKPSGSNERCVITGNILYEP